MIMKWHRKSSPPMKAPSCINEVSRVLVTGHRGFLGRRLVPVLQAHLTRVHIIDYQSPIPFDDLAFVKSFLSDLQPGAIFHLASHKGQASGTTQTLLEALLELGSSCCVVLPGSAAEYGQVPADQLPVREDFPGKPLSAYGLDKQSQTRLAKEYAQRGVHVVTARIFNVIGKEAPEHTLIGSFLSKLRAACAPSGNRTVRVGDLCIKRDFVDVEDVCYGLIRLAQFGTSGEVYNLCSGHSVALESVLRQMITAAGMSIQVVADSPLIAKNPVTDIYGSTDKTRDATGWSAKYRWDEAVGRLFT
jgi:GDP-4-dehydro-6-deoxy-D-mannose reductase